MDPQQIIQQLPFKDFINKLLGPAADELGLWMGEKIRILRFTSSIKIFKKAQKQLEDAGLEAKPIDLKTLVPLIQYCSLEDENSELVDKWAGLISTASTQGLKTYSYPHILNQLTPTESKLLDILHDFTEAKIPKEQRYINGPTQESICKTLKITQEESEIYFDNLFRLGLCQPAGSEGMKFGNSPVALKTYEIICMTPLGMDFVKACRGTIASS